MAALVMTYRIDTTYGRIFTAILFRYQTKGSKSFVKLTSVVAPITCVKISQYIKRLLAPTILIDQALPISEILNATK